MPEPLNDPPEHSTCTADITPFINPDNKLGNGNNQLMVCHDFLFYWLEWENTACPSSAALH